MWGFFNEGKLSESGFSGLKDVQDFIVDGMQEFSIIRKLI
jgi:hypothetical protein